VEPLITTALGLFVAVPAVWAYNYFTNRVEAFGRRDGQLLHGADQLLHPSPGREEVSKERPWHISQKPVLRWLRLT